jgi:hypothetical protein
LLREVVIEKRQTAFVSGDVANQRDEEQALLLIDYLLMGESRRSPVPVQSVRPERKRHARH